MAKYTIIPAKFYVLELFYDSYNGAQVWRGFTQAFETRKAAAAAMAKHVNNLSGARRGWPTYAKADADAATYYGTLYYVCDAAEAQKIVNNYPFWGVLSVPSWAQSAA